MELRVSPVRAWADTAQTAYAIVTDVAKVVVLVKTIMRSEEAAQATISAFTKAMGRFGEALGEGIGTFFSGLNIGLDARVVFGTQLAVDTASFLIGIASFCAGLMGATAAAAMMGRAGGIAIGDLTKCRSKCAETEDAKRVGEYGFTGGGVLGQQVGSHNMQR